MTPVAKWLSLVRKFKSEHPGATVLAADDPPHFFGFVCYYVDKQGKEHVANFMIRWQNVKKECVPNKDGDWCIWNGIDLGREGRQKFAQSVLPESVLVISEERME